MTDGTVLVGADNGDIFGITPTGQLRWRWGPAEGRPIGAVERFLVSTSRIFADAAAGVVALDLPK